MPRICTACAHQQRVEIDRQLLSGVSYRKIAEHFHVTAQAQLRHKADHLLPELVKAQQAEEVSRATDLLDMALKRDQKALELMAKSEADGDIRTAGQMLRISLTSLELLARLRGELNEQATVNILVAPEWLATRTEVMRALEPYVEARLAVSAALVELEARQVQEGDHDEHGG